MNYCIKILFTTCLFGFLSCNGIIDPEDDPPVDVSNDQQYELLLGQKISSEGAYYTIGIRSIQGVECENASLNGSILIEDDITVDITDIQIPDTCEDGISYPEIVKDLVIGNGITNLNITIKDNMSFGTIRQSNIEILLQLEETDNSLVVSNMNLQKLPDDIIWGYYDTGIAENPGNEIIDPKIDDINSQPVNLMSGNYDIFQVDQEKNIVLSEAVINSANPQFFVIRYSDQIWEQLKELFIEEAANYNNFNARLFSWDGRTWGI